MAPRLVFMGTPAFAVPSLRALVEAGLSPLRVITRPDQPKGRGLKTQPSEVREAAESLGLPVEAPPKFHAPEHLESLTELRPDLFVIVAYGVILKEPALAIPALGSINLHASLLPRWRGVSPIAWQILSGDKLAGVSTQWIDAGVDTGDVIYRDSFPMPEGSTTGTLTEVLAEHGAALLLKSVREALEGSAPREKQERAGTTVAPRFSKTDGIVDWTRDAAWIERAVRAFDPWPRLKFQTQSGGVRIVRATVSKGNGVPGMVLAVASSSIHVAAGKASLEILEVQPDGGKLMSAGAWARGRRIDVGEVFPGKPAS